MSPLNTIYQNNLTKAHIEIIPGHAGFTYDPKATVEINVGKSTALPILTATDGMPSHLQESHVPGASLGLASDGFFQLEHCFAAGYIVVEMAGILSALESLMIQHDKGHRNFDIRIRSNYNK